MPIVVPPRGTRGSEWQKRGRPVFRSVFRLMHLAYRAFGARMRVQGLPVIELETTGAKSGAKRYTVVASLPDPAADEAAGGESRGSWLVVAAAAGSARHPAWFFNLARHPDQVWVSAGGRRIKVRPETLEGAEFEEAWRTVALKAPGIGRYREITDRVIPLIRLRAEDDRQQVSSLDRHRPAPDRRGRDLAGRSASVTGGLARIASARQSSYGSTE